MIPYILIIAGILLVAFGTVNLIRIAVSPLRHKFQLVFNRRDDYIFYESGRGKRLLKKTTKEITNMLLTMIVIGLLSFFLGMYLGFAARGDDFWFYQKIFGKTEKEEEWDKVTDEGKFIASDGAEYAYYICVSGDKVSMNGEECSIEDLDDKLSSLHRGSAVVLVDDFAVASTYHRVDDLLNEKVLDVKRETE